MLNVEGVQSVNFVNSKELLADKKQSEASANYDQQEERNHIPDSQRFDGFEKSLPEEDLGMPKKLTSEQLQELQLQREEMALNFIKDSVRQNTQNQAAQANSSYVSHAGFNLSSETADLYTSIFGSLESALPTPATTPEGALANISEGGSYSVEAVSERIMKMATTFAAGDPETLAEMKEAVKKGFEAAGLNLETGEGMPDITMKTYNHVMNEFDKLLNPEAVTPEEDANSTQE